MCRTPNVFLSSDLCWHAVKIFPPWCSQNRPFIHPSQPGLTPVFSLPYLPGLALPISSSLILTPHRPPTTPCQTCTRIPSPFIILYRATFLSPLGISRKPVEPPSDTSTSPSWHSALTRPAKTWQPSTYSGRGGGIYECSVVNEAGISQIKTARWSGGEVSALIYPPVETCRVSPIHSSAVPLLWQPVCKYLLTLTRTKQCHCTSWWFSLHVSAECVCALARRTRACACVCIGHREYTLRRCLHSRQ